MNKNRNKIAAMMMVAAITVSSLAMPVEASVINNRENIILESKTNIQNIEGNVEVEFNEINFPDPGFREYIKTVMQINEGETFNTRSVRKIIFSAIEHETIKNLKGIEFFENLELLDCANNEIEGILDLSRNKKLLTLDCSGNNITEIKMDSNTPLTKLECYNNQLTELNCLKNNKTITYLDCSQNNFEILDISSITNLETLDCGWNKKLTDLILNESIKILSAGELSIENLVLSNKQNLEEVDCGADNGNLKSINTDGCKNLKIINLRGNKIKNVDFDENTLLKKVILSKNDIEEIDFDGYKNLEELYCSENNNLNLLNIRNCSSLKILDIGITSLKGIDLTTNKVLENINIPLYNIGYIDANNSISGDAFGNEDFESFVEEGLIKLNDNDHKLNLQKLFPGININKVRVLTNSVKLNKNGILEWGKTRPEEIEYIYDTGIKNKPLKVRLDLPYSDEEDNETGTTNPEQKPEEKPNEKPNKKHEKIIGSDRYETAAKMADKMGSYNTVILVNSDKSMADGLSAASLSGKKNAPILLVKQDKIPKATMDRIKKANNVYIVGGENAISKNVEKKLKESGKKINRIAGKDRYDTSREIAKLLGGYDKAFIVNGAKGEADAMSVSAVAAKYGAPILLTNGKTSIHDKKSGVKYYAIGGTSVIDNKLKEKYSAERVAGSDRYATNREIMDEFYWNSEKVYFAKGDTLIDALTASALAKDNGIVLVSKNKNHSELEGKDTVQVGGMNFEIDFE